MLLEVEASICAQAPPPRALQGIQLFDYPFLAVRSGSEIVGYVGSCLLQ